MRDLMFFLGLLSSNFRPLNSSPGDTCKWSEMVNKVSRDGTHSALSILLRYAPVRPMALANFSCESPCCLLNAWILRPMAFILSGCLLMPYFITTSCNIILSIFLVVIVKFKREISDKSREIQ